MRLPFLFGFTALRKYGLTLKRRPPPSPASRSPSRFFRTKTSASVDIAPARNANT